MNLPWPLECPGWTCGPPICPGTFGRGTIIWPPICPAGRPIGSWHLSWHLPTYGSCHLILVGLTWTQSLKWIHTKIHSFHTITHQINNAYQIIKIPFKELLAWYVNCYNCKKIQNIKRLILAFHGTRLFQLLAIFCDWVGKMFRNMHNNKGFTKYIWNLVRFPV